MSTTWKTVPVFISSTFRDMHAERDWLVKRVFPALRERLEKYRIHLVDIDLRWGITEEEAQRDQVLDLCLSLIDECRPFFVGILGERYGWVPKTFSKDAADKYGWIQYHTGKSVTELEIVYGVLNDPKMHDHGMFFFREPAFIDEVPEAKQADMLAEDEASAEKLTALKQAIRDTPLHFPTLDGYACQYAGLRVNWQLVSVEIENEADREVLRKVAEDGIVDPREYAGLDDRARELIHRFGVVHLEGLEEFGRQVSEQLWQAIKAEHELPDTPPAATLAESDPLAEEAGYHEEFMESRLRVHVGGQQVQDRLMALAEGDAAHPCLVTGPSGSGKSAALARFVRSYADKHPDVLLVPHFVGASPGSAGLSRMLRRFCMELQQRFGPADKVPADVNGLVSRFREAIEGVPDDARVMIVIDALNQLDETDNAHSMYWLPWELPPRVKVVISCINDAAEGEEPTEPVLKALTQQPHERLTIRPLTGNERLEIVSRVPSLSAKKLDSQQVQLLLQNPATENPLYLAVALEELRGFGSFGHLRARIAAFPRGENALTLLFGQVLERLEEGFQGALVRETLSLIAAGRSGLHERALQQLLARENDDECFALLRQLRPYLLRRGAALDFFHGQLREAVFRRYFCMDSSSTSSSEVLCQTHSRISRFLESNEANAAWRFRDLVYHLVHANDSARLRRLFDTKFLAEQRDAGFPLQEIDSDTQLALQHFCQSRDICGMFGVAAARCQATSSGVSDLSHVEKYPLFYGACLCEGIVEEKTEDVISWIESLPCNDMRARVKAEFVIGGRNSPRIIAFRDQHATELAELSKPPLRNDDDRLVALEALGKIDVAFDAALSETEYSDQWLGGLLRLVSRNPSHPKAKAVLIKVGRTPANGRVRDIAIAASGLLDAKDSAETQKALSESGNGSVLSWCLAAYLRDDRKLAARQVERVAASQAHLSDIEAATQAVKWFAPQLSGGPTLSRLTPQNRKRYRCGSQFREDRGRIMRYLEHLDPRSYSAYWASLWKRDIRFGMPRATYVQRMHFPVLAELWVRQIVEPPDTSSTNSLAAPFHFCDDEVREFSRALAQSPTRRAKRSFARWLRQPRSIPIKTRLLVWLLNITTWPVFFLLLAFLTCSMVPLSLLYLVCIIAVAMARRRHPDVPSEVPFEHNSDLAYDMLRGMRAWTFLELEEVCRSICSWRSWCGYGVGQRRRRRQVYRSYRDVCIRGTKERWPLASVILVPLQRIFGSVYDMYAGIIRMVFLTDVLCPKDRNKN